MAEDALELALRWEVLCIELMERTGKFPRDARYSLGGRIDEASLDVLTLLVDARYRTGGARATALNEVNLRLSRLRAVPGSAR